jgi:uncharacterized membrane protein
VERKSRKSEHDNIFFGNIFFRERISIKDALAILVVSYGAFMLNFLN